MSNNPDTFFAPAKRDNIENILTDYRMLEHNEIAKTLLNVKNGIVLIVNKNRQIVSVSDDFLQTFENSRIETVLGLRPGELFECVHSHEMCGGCGTSKSCESCGAVIAMMSCFEEDRPIEKVCALHTNVNGVDNNDLLKVFAFPLEVEYQRFVVVLIQNITKEQNWDVLQQVFFHDINNLLGGLSGISELLLCKTAHDTVTNKLSKKLHGISNRIMQEISFQECLFEIEGGTYHVVKESIDVYVMLLEIENFFITENVSNSKTLNVEYVNDIHINSDITLINKILHNLIKNALEAVPKNALEAVPKNGVVNVKYFMEDNNIIFEIHNDSYIEQKVQEVMFQRNFSTKSTHGRGVGLYSVQLFGETFLKGKISFESSEDKGTTFRFTLPFA